MARENVEIVRAAYSAYEGGGVEALFPYFAPDIEWDMTKTGIADHVYTGPDGVREFFERLGKAWEDYAFNYRTFLDADDEVLAIGGFRGRAANSGVEVEAPLVHIWKLRDGKGIRLRAYLDYSEALEAAVGMRYRGMPESVEMVQTGLDAFARRDLVEYLECFDPEAEGVYDESFPDARTFRGHEGIERWWHGLTRNWEDFEMDAERFIHDGDRVAALLKVSARSRASGVPVEGEFGGLFTFGNGRVVKWEIYPHWAGLLEAWELHQSAAEAIAPGTGEPSQMRGF